MTTGCSGADPGSTGSRAHHWGTEYNISEKRASEPRFNKPSTAPAPIPRKLVNAVRCHGSVHLRQGENAAALRYPGCQSCSSIHQPSLFLCADLMEMCLAYGELYRRDSKPLHYLQFCHSISQRLPCLPSNPLVMMRNLTYLASIVKFRGAASPRYCPVM